MTSPRDFRYPQVIAEICNLDWQGISGEDMTSIAWAYHFFSIQFRENLKTARRLHPHDEKLRQLEAEECDTDNLAPWPGVAAVGEKMNHDEFMRRTLDLMPIDTVKFQRLQTIGHRYLREARALNATVRAASIASYEDGGLERVFKAILGFCDWNTPLLQAFEHFLAEHVRFDSDPDQGHGALSRHIEVDDRILPLWEGFRELLVTCVPSLLGKTATGSARLHELDNGFEALPQGAERVVAYAPVHATAGLVGAHDDPVCHS
ncbi:hypothetical protein [Lichenicoccus sp.]|uniref:hypothetical protein n=1 Tax=Lichenicoccus sp. TaxID=2781899 RepID=UPI003D117CCC